MRKLKRKKILRDHLENQLFKYERRIQRLAEEAYKVRQALEIMDRQEAERNKSKGEITDAICETGIEAAARSGESDSNVGQSELSNNAALEAVLGEQPTELPSDK